VAAATYRSPVSRAVYGWFVEDIMSIDPDRFYRFVLEELTRHRSLHYGIPISRHTYREAEAASLEVVLPARVIGGRRQHCYEPLQGLLVCYVKYGLDLGVLISRSGMSRYVGSAIGKLKRPGKRLVVSPLNLYYLYGCLAGAGLDYSVLYTLADYVKTHYGEVYSGDAAALEITGRLLELSWDRIKGAEEVLSAARLPEEDYRLIEEAASYITQSLREVKKAAASGDIESVYWIVDTPVKPLVELDMDPGVKVYKYEAPISWIATYLDRGYTKGAASAEDEHALLRTLRTAAADAAASRAIAEVMKSLIPPDGRLWR